MIAVEALSKNYGSHWAVDGLSFEAPEGQVTGVVGPNGAGKSTTLRCLLGLDTPASGSARIDGVAYRDLPDPTSRVGALLDPAWVHPGRSAGAHLRCVAQTAGLPERRVAEVLDVVGLTSVAGHRVSTFSLGMCQRLGLAVALLGRPTHLVLDEPLNGLDPEGVRWARGLIRSYADQGHAVLISSRLLSELAVVADSVVLLGRGRFVGHYGVAELVAEAPVGPVVLRADAELERLRTVLGDRGWRVVALDGGRPASLSSAEGVVVESTGNPATVSTDEVGRVLAAAGIAVFELGTRRAPLADAVLEPRCDHLEFASRETA